MKQWSEAGDSMNLTFLQLVDDGGGGDNGSSMLKIPEGLVGTFLECDQWLSPQHLLFQLANVCFTISYLGTNGTYGILFMHTVLIFGFLLFSTWAWNVICAPDVFAWNFSFMICNLFQMMYILYQMRPVRFSKELEDIYENLFQPLQITRQVFKRLVSQEYAQVLSLHTGEAYAMQNLTRTDRLGLLITGKVNVMTDNHFLHHIYAKQFLDSPEFESSRAGVEEKFKVTIIAATPCRYVFWQRDSLEYLFVKETYLAQIMSILIARDVTTKLYAMNEKSNAGTAPVLLWLQGGPGASSLLGLFAENGPFQLNSDLELSEANYTWASEFNMLYVDNPVGAGFSFTSNKSGYARTEDDVSRDLYEALVQFFTLFTEHQGSEFYVTGESYAGKYVPAVAHKIHAENPSAKLRLNLKGLSIGNGLVDPATQYGYGDFLYNLGLVDARQQLLFLQQQSLVLKAIAVGDYIDALNHFNVMVVGGNDSYFQSFTGLDNMYNYLEERLPCQPELYQSFVTEDPVRKSIHVGNQTFDRGSLTKIYLMEDIMNSTKTLLEDLLSAGYKVLLYNGQLDVCIPYVLTENLIRNLNWTHSDEYESAERTIWKVTDADGLPVVAGYQKKVYNLQEVVVRNAGHMVPMDQPKHALDMISRFVLNKAF